MTWPVAQSYCRETYVDLATVESELDWLRLKAEVTREGLTDVAWVGLYFYNNWRWSLEDVPLRNTFRNWYSGQPGSSIGPRCCTSGPYGYWWNYPCTDLYPFICYNGKLIVCLIFWLGFCLLAGLADLKKKQKKHCSYHSINPDNEGLFVVKG